MYTTETPQDAAKYAVGRAAVERYAHDGARLGLGSGTTSAWFVRALGEKVADGLEVIGVPTSNSTRDLALSVGITLVDINELDRPLDVTLDGPDEVDHDGDMIKGGGACLLWERMVAEASTRMVCIADDTKLVDTLGAFPLPIEVVTHGWKATQRSVAALLQDLGYSNFLIDRRHRHGEPVVTDNGNFILDAHLGRITDKAVLDTSLNLIPGVAENGMFTGVASEILVASPNGSIDVIALPHRVAARKINSRQPTRRG
ncbi:ribose-5-phosphate isomerase RpiA [Rhodococcus sp. BP-349]|uniref:ribose-5-phosphate isomerase RpiA n=1 Tax=unclassified Rhodococcus (in: high G+C Gram-positive bacteria) TaxID=192944 RepID=UPI001C9A7CD6|nr:MULTISPECIES: ribose-5-phosphate isomerase RpiA [unclassified Rhodococcus (in: high G+C Gram-positive bacteria)]MBY6537279.1 ribose-5-phosphate isomerase RpiA [Rhodococcus sp. BP-363]MBY6541616.1 ribose-5-phosphate isomerase RpiA [Rhodococcus sp. BP-369]MBY6560846.1 ribose-5-phosphate isomerase RpiA [Rhodococcus sp. BP-370]MBY6575138.1 ribose-5-phosphate isomerase RpiA [Rhodococcus sp. BP-364]MBY6584439.1 ribose-5-phosphate isomerase RpiA [Rhodococcus sp. BP-358]